MSAVRQFRALVLKDLRLELRTRDTAIAMTLFVVIAMVILQFGFGTRESDLTRFAGGLLWVPLAFAAGVYVRLPVVPLTSGPAANSVAFVLFVISNVST
mgnify:CR=1 FL=1